MAASSSAHPAPATGTAAEPEPGVQLQPEQPDDGDPSSSSSSSGALPLGRFVKREPVVKLLFPVTGLEPLTWSQDHRLSVSTASGISLMEVVCDVHSSCQDLVLNRTSIPVSERVTELKVGPAKELLKAKEKFACSANPAVVQSFMLDHTINPASGSHKGIKYCSWSPPGCDVNGRCLLASLTLDHRLCVHSSQKRLQWTELADLTQLYGDSLESRGYSLQGGGANTKAEPPKANLQDLDELRRRFHMQTAVRMEWSSVCTTQHVQSNTNECKDVDTVLLAVLMENGDLVVWQFRLPFLDRDSVLSCNTIPSGVAQPSVLAWWEYEHGGRKMSGLIVGSTVGPVKILPVNLKAVKGYFTLRQPVVLWQESDQVPVHNIKCVTLFHPVQKCNCSLVVAARGCYVFWCLLVISKAGLNVHNSHVTGLHSAPIVSMAAGRLGGAGSIYTCSLDGTVKKLTPVFTDSALTFGKEEIVLPDGLLGRRMHGIAVSPNGAYLSLVSAEGMVKALHPVQRTFQVHFVTLKTPEEAAAELQESTVQNLFKQADLLDLVRWRVLRDKRIPPPLREELDGRIRGAGGTAYLWRFKLFLVRVLYQSLQKAPVEARWKPRLKDPKVFVEDGEGEGDEGGGGGGGEAGEGAAAAAAAPPKPPCPPPESVALEGQMREVTGWIEEVEAHLTRESMKRVLGEVYLHTWVAENTSIPSKGMCDFLTSDPTCEDRAAKVLIGHIQKKMNKQTFPEYCSLCKEVLPFTDRRQAACSNGHMWLRCVLSYQACQTLTYRRCLLQDSIARLPVSDDPDWIKRILKGPCTFCDAPLF